MKISTAQLYNIKSLLLAKAKECRWVLSESREQIRMKTAPEAVDRKLRAAERNAAAEKMANCFRLLKQIETALTRVDRGRYGLCVRCENAIEQERLNTLPWTLFCIQCQCGVDLLHDRAQARRNNIRQAA